MHGGNQDKNQNGRHPGKQTSFHGDPAMSSSPAKIDPKSQKDWELSVKHLPVSLYVRFKILKKHLNSK